MPSIYSLKAICAFFVVIIHSYMWGKHFFYPLLLVAVPCFYMCTGYFICLYQKTEVPKKIKSWIVKSIIILLVLNFVYYCVEIVRGTSVSIYDVFVAVVEGGILSIHLWYLSSLWQSLLVFLLLFKLSRKLLFLGPVLYIVIYSLNPVFFHVQTGMYIGWEEHAMSVFYALCYLCMGYLLAFWKYRETKRIYIDIVVFIVSFVLLKYVPRELLCFRICLLVLESVSFFSIALKFSNFRVKWLEWIGKYHSSYIYFFHPLISLLYRDAIIFYPFLYVYEKHWALLFFILSLLLSILINLLREVVPQLWRCFIR